LKTPQVGPDASTEEISNARVKEALIKKVKFLTNFASVEPEEGTKILLSPSKLPFFEHSTHPKNPMSIFYFLGTT
jgi:hypothetical protein